MFASAHCYDSLTYLHLRAALGRTVSASSRAFLLRQMAFMLCKLQSLTVTSDLAVSAYWNCGADATLTCLFLRF